MQITPNIHALRIPFEIPLFPGQRVPRFVYQYLITGERLVLIDTGVASATAMFWDYLALQGWDRSAISTIILTHSHPDHLGAALPIQRACQCAVWGHAAEQTWMEDVALQQRQRPVPGFSEMVAGSVTLTRVLQGEEILSFGDLELRILHVPGHSAGSIAVWMPNEGVLITGDAIPQPGSMPIYDDVLASACSIRRLLDLPGVELLLSSWDEPRHGLDAYQAMQAGLDYLRTIHNTVLMEHANEPAADPMQLCRQVVESLGLPPFAANPFVAQSIAAHLRVKDQTELMQLCAG